MFLARVGAAKAPRASTKIKQHFCSTPRVGDRDPPLVKAALASGCKNRMADFARVSLVEGRKVEAQAAEGICKEWGISGLFLLYS